MSFSRHANLIRAFSSAMVSVLLLAGAVFGANTVGLGSRPAGATTTSSGAPERSPVDTVLAALGLHEDADEADAPGADENDQAEDADEQGEDAENCDAEDEAEDADVDENQADDQDVEDEDVHQDETATDNHGAAVSAVAKDAARVDLTAGGQCTHGGAVSKAAHDKAEAAKRAANKAQKAREAAERAREAARRHAEDRDDHEQESDRDDHSGEHGSDDDSGDDD
jgi:hypothetical protein